MIGRQRTPRRWSRAIRHALGGVLAMLAACQAYAHNAGVSTSRIAIHGRAVALEINALGRDYEKAADVRIAEGTGQVNPVALASAGLHVRARPSFSRFAINKMIEAAGRNAGIERPLHPHCLRHTTGSVLANGGMSAWHLQKHLGHANMSNTIGYVRMSPEPLRAREAVVVNLQHYGQFNQPPSDWPLGISQFQIGLSVLRRR